MDLAPQGLDDALAKARAALAAVDPPPSASIADLERAAAALADRAAAFARTPPLQKAALLRAAIPSILAVAPEMVSQSCLLAGVDPGGALAGAAWLTGPVALLAAVRRYAEALEDIARGGRPFLPASHLRGRLEGRVLARLSPRTFAERAQHGGDAATAVLAEGVTPEQAIAGQAAFYRQAEPAGGVARVAGRGVAPALRALDALFVEGKVALVETSVAGVCERALAPLVEAGFLRLVHGSGAPGPSRGGGPVIVVPALYAGDELWFIARRLVSEIAAGQAFGAGAPREIVLGGCWAQRGLFLEQIERALALCPLPLPLSTREEAAAGAVGIVTAGCDEPAAMIAAAVERCNAGPEADGAEIVVHVVHEEDPETHAALERAAVGLRCRALGINQWPALVALRGDAPEGPRMLAGVDKTIVRGPLRSARRPAYFLDEPRAARRGARLCGFQAAPSLGALLRGARG